MLTIEEIKRAVTKVGKKYGIKSAYLFGSYAKNTANENSDVDLLIDAGEIRDLIELSGFQLDMAEELGTSVDILTTNGIKPRFFDLIRNDRILVYGA
ncbi:nucleotidyltransferase domain-containing protein [Candidatus Saccharibacteria bacterium]|nr:nucleotidyltransferase domain-containing protein [Candidatus Saccharibacteria bacterium]